MYFFSKNYKTLIIFFKIKVGPTFMSANKNENINNSSF